MCQIPTAAPTRSSSSNDQPQPCAAKHAEQKFNRPASGTAIMPACQVIVADDAPELIEGSWHGKRTVIVEFDSVQAARNWYRPPEYQGRAGLRHAAADSNAVIVAGFELPTG